MLMSSGMADSQAAEPGKATNGIDRSATLAALLAGEADTVSAEDAPTASDAPAEAVSAEPSEVEAAPVEVTEPADDELAEDEKPVDAKAVKGIEAVQRAKQREAAALAKERAEIAREREELATIRAQRDEFEKLKARAKYDPASVLAALGLSDDDFEPAARDLYARSKGAAADPKTKEAALRMQREREQADRLASVEKQLAETREQLMKREAEARAQAEFERFVGDVKKSATDETPLVRLAFEKSPAKAQAAIAKVAYDLWQEQGEEPTPADVVAHYEKIRRAELDELGVDVSAVIKTAPKKQNQTADKKQPAKTLSTDLSTTTPVRGPAKSLEEHRAETRRLLEAGKLE